MKYKVFGLIIETEISLPQASAAILDETSDKTDIFVLYNDLSKEYKIRIGQNNQIIKREESLYCYDVKDVGRFKITDGNKIEIDPCQDVAEGLLAVYILGGCMGCVFMQRGIFAMHGSCICKNNLAI